MFDYEKWHEIYSVLRKNKLRTFLTAMGVAWGIFMLIVMLAAGTGLQNGIIKDLGGRATNSVFIWTRSTTIPYKGFPRGRRFNYENKDTEILKNNIDEIKYIAPRLRNQYTITRGLKTEVFTTNGDRPDIAHIEGLIISAGRFINETDQNEKRKVAVIGKRVQDIIFDKDENPIGEYIKIQGVFFKVVGVFKSKKRNKESSKTIYIPLSAMQQTYNLGKIVGWYSITAKDNTPVKVVQDKAVELLKKSHSISPDDKRAIGYFNLNKEYTKIQTLFTAIEILIWIVGLGTLFAGVIGVSNIMLIVVKERTKEIGIRRAIGATPIKIMKQIITESVFITAVSGYMGLVFAVIVIEIIGMFMPENNNSMFAKPEVNFSIAIAALLLLIISGALAGIMPASRALRIKPIEALRTE